jgi:hypothetical protein
MGDSNPLLEFAGVLSSVTDAQRTALLKSVTSRQCQLLREIAFNILFNTSITISEKDKNYFKNSSYFIKLLASKRVCQRDKKKFLLKKRKLIKKLSKTVHKYLTA